MPEQTSDFNAAEALSALNDTRAAWANRPTSPKAWRYDVLYGALIGVMTGGQALPVPLSLIASLGGGALMLAMCVWWVRKSGFWISGLAPRRARWVAVGLGLLYVVAAIGAFEAAHSGMAWLGWPIGAVMAVAGAFGARLWREVYRSDMADATDLRPDALAARPQLIIVAGGAAVILVTVGAAVATHNFEAEWFFYGTGIGVGVLVSAGIYMLVKTFLFRGRR